jgi:hypothetical protein
MKLAFRFSNNQRLIIVEKAVEQMLAFRQCSWWHSEAGGVLLGRHLLDTDDIVVDEVTTPQKSDRRSRFGFFRSKKHEKIAQSHRSLGKSSTDASILSPKRAPNFISIGIGAIAARVRCVGPFLSTN